MSRSYSVGLRVVACAAVTLFYSSGCGGGSGYSSSPTTPSTGTTGGGASSTISIVGDRGNQSFAPNPANVSTGTTFSWTNNDSVTHHIVFDDGTVDSGNLAPGQTSAARTMPGNGARYHCTIHPTMVGSINTSAGTPPPCTGVYCDSQ
jgi:plastocyanin